MNMGNAYICSVCGKVNMGAGTCDINGSHKNGPGGYCTFCRNLMLDTGVDYLDYTQLVHSDPNYEQMLIDTIVIPYGKYNQYESKRSDFKIQRNRAEADKNAQRMANAVTCPYCKSTNTKKITVAGRAVSIGFFGLASSKVGKQWHCDKCKSDF